MSDASKKSADFSAEQKRALLAQLLAQESKGPAYECPLSYGQRAMWFLHRLAPQSSAFHVLFAARIRSKLDVSALRRALQALINRHDALRATYLEKDGEPAQRINETVPLHFHETDASGWSEAFLWDRMGRDARAPFNLFQDPVLRAHLFTRSEDEHYLIMAVHHIAIDGWSLWVCLEELGVLYAAETSNSQTALSPAGPQYRDYIGWQQSLVESPEGQRLWRYWEKQLAGDLPVLDLPTDRARPTIQGYRGASHSFKLDEELTRQLKMFSRAAGATVYMTLLAAFQVLLYRYTGQEDILVGSPTPGRDQPAFEGMVGYCANPVVLRANFAKNLTFQMFLRQVRDTVLDAFEHQAYPFPLLVERLRPDRYTGRSPLFQAVFAFQKPHRLEREGIASFVIGGSAGSLKLGELVLEPLPFPIQQEGQFDLTLNVVEVEATLSASFDYSTDLFDPSTIAGMEGHWRMLLESLITRADEGVALVPLLTRTERSRLLEEWNNTKSDFRQDRCLHELFEAQVQHAPDAIAVIFGERRLTYGELNRRANQLAHYLRAQRVGPEVRVGISMERSPEMIVGILGVLKAGGAYVPLDPTYPRERLAFMLQDAEISVVLTDSSQNSELPVEGKRVVSIDPDWKSIPRQPEENPVAEVRPENLCYVIYTSGSTGTPKGALVTHANVTRLFAATQPWFQFDERDVWTLFHSYAFDFSVWEIWGALLYGGRLVIVPFEVSRSPEAFYELVSKEQVTVLNQTPSAFRQFIWVDEKERQKNGKLNLRRIIFGGEALDVQSLGRWFERHGDSSPELVNMYGITETTVHVTYRRLLAADVQAGRQSPIGVPIPDLQVYVLDSHLNLLPIGVHGEIYVGGDGLARGYLNRSDLTAERFLPDPFTDRAGARLYKTGDLARCLPDGSIEFLGRIDHQVKVRGFRVELGEIEAHLARHQAIREAVVVAREDNPGEKRLVAYVVAESSMRPSPQELRSFLEEQLPDFMIPTAFILMEGLPMTPTGKLDRKSLPAPDGVRQVGETYVGPRNELEFAVAKIWQEVLNLEQIGMHDNFFDLGGNSLLMVQVDVRLRPLSHKPLRMIDLFQYPTISSLANYLSGEKTEPAPQATVDLRVEPAKQGRQRLQQLQQRRDEEKRKLD